MTDHHEPTPDRENADSAAADLIIAVLWGTLATALLALALIFLAIASVSTARAEPLTGRIVVIDGDTIWHYPCPLGGGCTPQKIRLLDIDTPETRGAACEGERAAGYLAKAQLILLLAARPIIIERCDQHGDRCEDRFGRTLARIHTPQGEIGKIMIERGHALPYTPGGRQARVTIWCGRP